jgi:hypothetical protein
VCCICCVCCALVLFESCEVCEFSAATPGFTHRASHPTKTSEPPTLTRCPMLLRLIADDGKQVTEITATAAKYQLPQVRTHPTHETVERTVALRGSTAKKGTARAIDLTHHGHTPLPPGNVPPEPRWRNRSTR